MADDVMELAGPLSDRDRWTAAQWCPLERALDLIGTRSAMTLLREVFYGGRRFDDLVRRAGVTDAVGSKRLRQLVEAGMLTRVPYREPGQRTRHEYVLTEQGRELFPLLVSLIRFGSLLPAERPGELELTHAGCGAEIEPRVRCAAGHDVPVADTVVRVVKVSGGLAADATPPVEG
ncbi:helix-turn-helix domain-containing protein [Streptomyces sp. NPDC046870]|uniref:winged helix-turn-helix transcriptional regulator n=1 Tax=Streptomyces sp. NPDC046870 TaxID=3155135 RepID=UPI0034569880